MPNAGRLLKGKRALRIRLGREGDEPTAFAYSFLDDNGIDWTFDNPGVDPAVEQTSDADPKGVSLYRGS